MDVIDLTALGAAELVARVHDGRSCALDVAEAHLARIAAHDAAHEVFCAHDPARVLAEARAVDTRHDRFALPLAGVPVAVDDSIDVAGYPTRHGCAGSPEAPRRDDELVKRLRAAGALIVGKTRVAELGIAGPARSAAAVADRMAALAVGVDGGDGLRVPAAHHGLVAVKPGTGAVPLPRGAEQLWRGLGATGALAHSAGDAALVLGVLARPPADFPPSEGSPPTPSRVALSLRGPAFAGRLHPDQQAAVIGAAARLRAWPGEATIGLADPPYPRGLRRQWRRRVRVGVADELATLHVTDARELDRRTVAVAKAGRRTARLAPPRARAVATWRARMEAWFDDGGYDLLLCPAVAGPPALVPPARRTAFTQAWNLAGLPAVVAPVVVDGRAAAVQLVGRPGAEAALLAAATLLEQRPVPAMGAAQPRVYA